MLAAPKDFKLREQEIRESFDPMLRVQEVRNIIGCSWRFVIELVRLGEIEAYDIPGRVVDRSEVDENSHGLRIAPSSLREYLDATKIR